MQYSEFGHTGIMVSKLGLGTNRFSPDDLKDVEGITRASHIVRTALEGGVNYIDSAYTYSKGKAELILKEALDGWKNPVHLVVKSAWNIDKTSDAVLRRIENSIKNMGLDKATFFLAWTITSYEEYQEMMQKDGYYEGAVKAKERGMIDHICFATHCTPEDTVKIINEGAFDGVTVNYSVLNAKLNEPILKAAEEKGIGVVTMSSLATGIIPKNPDFFEFIKMENDNSVGQAALRFVAAQKQISTTLCGVSSLEQMRDNLEAFSDDEYKEHRGEIVSSRFDDKKDYCDGCGKCKDICEANMDLPVYLQSYNARFLGKGITLSYARTDSALIEDIEIFKKMKQEYTYMPETIHNPCIDCGRCENICPKQIHIKRVIADIYERAEIRAFSKEAWKQRLSMLLNEKYKKVGFYPAGGYTGYVLSYFEEFYGKPQFDMVMYDSNSSMWGKESMGYIILNPDKILEEKPDCIVIANYIYSDEIYESLKQYKDVGIDIIPLHKKQDVPWVF